MEKPDGKILTNIILSNCLQAPQRSLFQQQTIEPPPVPPVLSKSALDSLLRSSRSGFRLATDLTPHPQMENGLCPPPVAITPERRSGFDNHGPQRWHRPSEDPQRSKKAFRLGDY
uniref:Uncharacterized protein n=1 Tax=Knipowitschia caucasica TaxID=637954 RepID=A0AAV2MNQ1_KNICA